MIIRRLLLTLLLMCPAWLMAARVQIPSGEVVLSAEYFRPKLPNMPVVLILHGCGGMYTSAGKIGVRMWRTGSMLQEMGYGVLYLDSFSVRGISGVCQLDPVKRMPSVLTRSSDAESAIKWLRMQEHIDINRIGVLAWSHGADSALDLLGKINLFIKAAVVFYPRCDLFLNKKTYHTSAPTLVLIGAEDKKSRASDCELLAKKTGQSLFYVVTYPGVGHDFDAQMPTNVDRAEISNLPVTPDDLKMVASPDATYDANRRAFKWFARWFDPERSIKGVPPIDCLVK